MSATRKPGRNFLFVPGPTNIPDRVLRAMHIAMEDHRSSDFPKLTLPLYERLKKIFKTKEGQVVIFPSSGTGAWEAALTNTLAPGNKVLIARFGQFSHLWGELAKRHGLDVIVQDEEWGTGANPERIEEALRADKCSRDQRRARGAQRDRHRRHQQCRRGAPRHGRGQASGAALCRRRFLDREASTSASTIGASTSPSPARRRASCFRQASASSAPAKRRSRR